MKVQEQGLSGKKNLTHITLTLFADDKFVLLHQGIKTL